MGATHTKANYMTLEYIYFYLLGMLAVLSLYLHPRAPSRVFQAYISHLFFLLLHITGLLPPFLPALFPQAQSPPPSNIAHDYAPGQLGG